MSETDKAAQIAEAVEKVLEGGSEAAAPVLTAAQKIEAARSVYLKWRNDTLSNLPPEVFHQIEAASGALISAIVELL